MKTAVESNISPLEINDSAHAIPTADTIDITIMIINVRIRITIRILNCIFWVGKI